MSPRWMGLAALLLTGLMSVSARAETIRVTIENLVFAPLAIEAKVGDTIEWVNKDVLAHTATATNHDWDVAIAPKQTARLTLAKPGAVDFYCKFHPNMKGRVVVTP